MQHTYSKSSYGIRIFWRKQRNKESEETLRNMQPGDLIEIDRFLSIYSHWAICCGNGMVAHFTGNSHCSHGSVQKSLKCVEARVRKDHFWDVVGSSRARVHNKDSKTEGEISIPSIMDRIETSQGKTGYNLLFCNCEHYATWCRYGHNISDQVDRKLLKLLRLLRGGFVMQRITLFLASLVLMSDNRVLDKNMCLNILFFTSYIFEAAAATRCFAYFFSQHILWHQCNREQCCNAKIEWETIKRYKKYIDKKINKRKPLLYLHLSISYMSAYVMMSTCTLGISDLYHSAA